MKSERLAERSSRSTPIACGAAWLATVAAGCALRDDIGSYRGTTRAQGPKLKSATVARNVERMESEG